MSCKVRPYGARFGVKREEAVRQVGSIVVPDSVADKEKPRKGIVLDRTHTIHDKQLKHP